MFSECQEKAKSIIVERAEMIKKLKELVVQK